MRLKSSLVTILAVSLIITAGLVLLRSNQPQIVKAGDNTFVTEETSFEAGFGGKEDPTRVVFKKDGSKLTFNLPYEGINWKKEGERLIADIGEDKSFSYSLLKDNNNQALGVKEEIILKEPTDGNKFQFSLDLEGLTPKKDKQGLWHFFNDDGKELFFIPKPYMEDAVGEKSEQVRIDINNDKLTVEADKEWLLSEDRKYPIIIDPSLQLTILTVHSHPQQGEKWQVDFETEGKADLRIIPDDQATIEDDEFKSLTCGDQQITPQILENDVIYVPNWECDQTGTVIHNTLKAGKHTLRFEFGEEIAYAYNAPGSTTYTFSGVTQDSNDYYAYEDSGASVFSGPDDTGTSEATDTDYGNIESDNDTRWSSANASSDGDYDAQLYKFFVDESEPDVAQLDLTWNGYGETQLGYNTTFYAWDYDSSQWVQLSQVDFTASTDQELSFNELADPGRFIDTDGEVTLMIKTLKYVGALGEECNTDEDCLSINCVDGVCCDTSSCSGCKSCNVAGNEGSCADDNSQCIDSGWDGCDGDCVKTKSNNGICTEGLCGTDSTNVSSGKSCSNGNEVSQACNSSWHCSGSSKCQYACDGSGNCTQDFNCDTCDYGCSAGECLNPCEDCICDGTESHVLSCSGDTVYVDCNADKCWTPTASASTQSNAIDYCDGLSYAGKSDWSCPTQSALYNLCTNHCSGTCFDDNEGYSAGYWASTTFLGSYPEGVYFSSCSKCSSCDADYVRCVR